MPFSQVPCDLTDVEVGHLTPGAAVGAELPALRLLSSQSQRGQPQLSWQQKLEE